jgi:ABC-type sugar transport system ATPase subunit
MTAAQNITFNLRNKKVPRSEIEERLMATARILGIEPLLGKKPDKLSGGERQRVALGRALIRKPRVFLMDEPLSNLDLKLREAMRIELGRLHQDLGVTMVFVTHDQSEAMTLSTAMAVLNGGRLQQAGRPDSVYGAPANTFVARFIGSPSMNIFRMRAQGGCFVAADDPAVRLPLPYGWHEAPGRDVLVGVRPHHLRTADEREPGIPVEVRLVEHLGRSNFVVCTPASSAGWLHQQDTIQFETDAGLAPAPSTRLDLTAEAAKITVFDAETGMALPHEPEPQRRAVAAMGKGA